MPSMFLRTVLCLILSLTSHWALATSDPRPIRFYDGGWENIQIDNHIAMYILKHGYGMKVESVSLDIAQMQNAMETGAIDINMEVFTSLMPQWVQDQTAKKAILDFGPTYERLTQAFYVPTYMIKGDAGRGIKPMTPDLKSVADLPRYAEVFRQASGSGKPTWLNCISSWACREINLIKMATYGIDKTFTPVELKSESALNAAIISAYEKGQPFMTYYWDPSPLMGELALTRLEEPAYSEACWEAIKQSLAQFKEGVGSRQACAYADIPLNKYTSAKFAEEHPGVLPFLKSMFVGTDTIRTLATRMVSNKETPEQTARYYLRNHTADWKGWVPEDVFKKVSETL
ncbi:MULTISPECIES: glycine betaine ABC transporter substrate-binding protein [unclassified Pseudomonas]|uniref:glycine betaine ABC transporter substrate-binding protein n=1 Tax=unclassified Pseudomonas TaxID=196821 RepID=UPI00119B3742|nr:MULTISPECIES: glycine betaine ABC transporter substrate-binding protein [unclassified Pseudomonas]TWC23119.1 glycine betaine/proline transport system substrate-binding protein [Pseudomonas sp. SJZ075]TWC24617.1 glycine betaine/proline transport system substrate-binding protein [Pseudomonas sp. SJZ074]TWC38001.1 glycine betaine/proline transport system substrate-binding protein [Pseudomonas sp. SJZ078]TWC41166.1 glycine betaine/proline transport system substrate-binding protein [Pseudomonas s